LDNPAFADFQYKRLCFVPHSGAIMMLIILLLTTSLSTASSIIGVAGCFKASVALCRFLLYEVY
jgi:hypothetical protein